MDIGDAGRGKAWYEDIFLIILLFLSLVLNCYQLVQISDITFVGYNDPAAYGNLAINVVQGKGLVVDFIDSFHVIRPAIPQATDHWFSFNVYLIAFFMLLVGKTALAVKLPTLMSFIIFPVLLYLLGRMAIPRLVSFCAAFTIMFHPVFLKLSITGYPDFVFHSFALAVIMVYLKSKENEINYIFLGILGALLFLIKSYAFLLFIVLFLETLLSGRLIALLKSRQAWVGLCLFLVIISPLLIRNMQIFDDPSLSYYKNLMFTLGYGSNAYSDHYRVFWDGPPTLHALISDHGIQGIANKALTTISQIWTGNHYFSYQPGIPGMMFSGIVVLVALGGAIRWWRTPLARITLLLLLVTMLFSGLCFAYQYRYYLLVTAFLFLFFFSVFLPSTGRSVNPFSERVSFTFRGCLHYLGYAASFLFLFFLISFRTLPWLNNFENPREGEFPQGDVQFMNILLEQVIRHTESEERVFSCLPPCLAFHTNRQAVMVPYGSMKDVMNIARIYKVKYYLDVVGKAHFFLHSFPEFVHVETFQNRFQRGDLYYIKHAEGEILEEERFNMPNNFMFPSSQAQGKDEMG